MNFQYQELLKVAETKNMIVQGVSRVVSNGEILNGFEYESLLTSIRRKNFDVLLIYSPLRISTNPNVYDEFKIYCHLYNVSIISLEDI